MRLLAPRSLIACGLIPCGLALLLLSGCIQSRPGIVAGRQADLAPTRPAEQDAGNGKRDPPASKTPGPRSGPTKPGGPQRRLWAPPPPPPSLTNPACCRLRRARRTSNWIMGGSCAAIGLYGLLFWDYGSGSFRATDDGWFEKDTKEGGADKAGHATAAAVSTAIFSALNRKLGLPRKEAALRGAITTFLFTSLIEIGDGYTKKYGWTYGDMVANTAGCIFGYFHETSPRFNRLFDLRWEYRPTHSLFHEATEPSTDYDGSSYFLALNVGAVVQPKRRTWWDVFDVQVGYQTRNYVDGTGEKERTVYLGLGINFATLLRRLGVRGFLPTIFEYYQPPFTSLRIGHDL